MLQNGTKFLGEWKRWNLFNMHPIREMTAHRLPFKKGIKVHKRRNLLIIICRRCASLIAVCACLCNMRFLGFFFFFACSRIHLTFFFAFRFDNFLQWPFRWLHEIHYSTKQTSRELIERFSFNEVFLMGYPIQLKKKFFAIIAMILVS